MSRISAVLINATILRWAVACASAWRASVMALSMRGARMSSDLPRLEALAPRGRDWNPPKLASSPSLSSETVLGPPGVEAAP